MKESITTTLKKIDTFSAQLDLPPPYGGPPLPTPPGPPPAGPHRKVDGGSREIASSSCTAPEA